MVRNAKLAALAIAGALAANVAYAEGKIAATVNGVPIPQDRVELRVKIVTNQGQPDNAEMRRAIRDDLINIEIMSQEAVKKGLDKRPENVQQLELARESVLVGEFVQDFVKSHPISDKAVADEYEKVKAALGNKEYHVRHILVDSEKEANEIEAKLKKGASFEKLALKSKDTGSRDHGGDVGWVPVGKISSAFVKEFGDALLKLKKGEISPPVQSQFGWHIIQLENVRDFKMPALEEIKPQLTQRLEQQALKDEIADLRAKAKVE